MSSVSQYFKGLFQGIGSLLTGMRVTWKELFTKKVTSQYPENRDTLVISDRFRCELVMPHDENNEHNCTSCGICQMNCPNGTIQIQSNTITTEDGKKKKILGQYHYNLGLCTFCNLCVLTCPSDAIVFNNDFESAMFTRGALIKTLNKPGSKLKEKKKPEPKVAPATEKAATIKPEIKESVTDKTTSNKENIEKPEVDKKPETIDLEAKMPLNGEVTDKGTKETAD